MDRITVSMSDNGRVVERVFNSQPCVTAGGVVARTADVRAEEYVAARERAGAVLLSVVKEKV